MRSVSNTLFGAAFTIATAWALGTVLLRKLSLALYAFEERLLAFITGSVCLSAIVFALCTVGLARKGVFLALGLLVNLLVWWPALRRQSRDRDPLPLLEPLNLAVRLPFALALIAITAAYFYYAFPPQFTPDILTYRLSLIGRAHGLPVSAGAGNLSQGLEMLLFYAVAITRYSAAVLVNFALLVSLPLLMFCYGRRIGYPAVGAAAAVLTYLTTLSGKHHTLAFTQAGNAVVLFALFYVLQLWDEQRTRALLILVGMFAGFSYAAESGVGWALAYSLGFIGWKLWRKRQPVFGPVVAVAALALVFILPWILLQGRWPVNPFAQTAINDSHWLIWMTLAFLSCVALCLPLGRKLMLAAAGLGLPYWGNPAPGFALPIMPFASLAMSLAVWRLPWFWRSTPVRFCTNRVARVPWYAWVVAVVVSPWIAAYTIRPTVVATYFRLEQRWRVEGRKQGMEEAVPFLCRIGLLGPARIQVEPGVSFLLDPRDLVSATILRAGEWQPEIWESIAPDLSEGAVFLDVGAHIGYFSIKASRRVGQTGHVLAFEPNPETLKLLRDNVTANKAWNVIVEPIACTDRDQMLTFYAAAILNTGASSLARKNADVSLTEQPRSYQVRGRRIDDVVRELKLARVDAIKIDVEGAEVYVLRGAVQTLKRFHPKLVIEEVPEQLANLQTTLEELISILKDAGYNRSRPIGPTDWEWTVTKLPLS